MIRFKMINLEKNSGLALKLDKEKLELVFGNDIFRVKPDVRTINQMQEVLMDSKLGAQEELYYMYRGLHRAGDDDKIKKNKLRYDITIIRSGFLGNEFVKTHGHYHLSSYPELYEVLWGEALCLLQRPSKEEPKTIEDVILVKAKAKEKIVVLPHYGHIMINPSSEAPLVTSNWVSSQFNSDYSFYKKAKGAAYFIVNNDGEINLIKNDFFKEVPEVRTMRPKLPFEQLGISWERPIYELLEEPEKLDFLNLPEKYDCHDCFREDKSLLSAVVE